MSCLRCPSTRPQSALCKRRALVVGEIRRQSCVHRLQEDVVAVPSGVEHAMSEFERRCGETLGVVLAFGLSCAVLSDVIHQRFDDERGERTIVLLQRSIPDHDGLSPSTIKTDQTRLDANASP